MREEFLVPLGVSAHALSEAIDILATRVNDIVNRKRGITADTALRLARYFGNSPGFWLNVQAAYDLRAANARRPRESSPRCRPEKRRNVGQLHSTAAQARENRVNQSGSVALSTEEVRGPP